MTGDYYFSGGAMYNQNLNGYWWSTLANNASNAYYLSIRSPGFGTQDSGPNNDGFSLRFIKARRYPLSYVMSGGYSWSQWEDGSLWQQNFVGVYWSISLKTGDSVVAISMNVYSGSLNTYWENGTNIGGSLRSTPARRYPLSYVNSGFFYYGDGNLYTQGTRGTWWSATATADINASYLNIIPESTSGGNNNKSYTFTLRSTYTRRYPLSYVYSGGYHWDDSSLVVQNEAGYWWSTTAEDNTHAYSPNIWTTYASPQGAGGVKVHGMALRSTSARRYPLSYVYSGNYAGGTGSMQYQGTDGYNWTTTAKDSNISYAFYFRDDALITIDREYPKTVYFALRFTFSRRYPLSYVRSGYYLWTTGGIDNQGEGGHYWSSTAYGNNNVYYFRIDASSILPQKGDLKDRGFSLR